MDDENDYVIPRTLDAPKLFFLWDFDVACLIIFWVIIGVLLEMFFVGVILAYFSMRGYAILKDEGGAGLIMKLLYWYTPSSLWGFKRYQSYIREYTGG